MNEIYERINALCQQQGITGSRMCKDLGISPSLLSDLKTGRRETPRPEKLKLIADYLGVSVQDLTDPDPAANLPPSALKAAFFGGYEGLTSEEIDEMWSDVRKFTDFIVEKKKQEKKG